MNHARFRSNFLASYVARAPLALAFERTLECRILSQQNFRPPVLDLGCGDGIFANTLFADVIETGIDPDKNELRQAGYSGSYRELICCVGSQIPKPDASYQTVLSNSVLEHIPDLSPVLSEVHRILAPGGCFYFTVPADNFEVWSALNQVLSRLGLARQSLSYRRFFNRFWRHYHAYPEAGWSAVATHAGFDVTEIFRYNAPRLALGNDLLTPLALPSMLLHKIARRWVVSTTLRRIAFFPFRSLFHLWLTPVKHPEGCLVFVKAVKSHASI